MKEIIKIILKSSAIGKLIYPIVQGVYRSYAIPLKRKRLQKFGTQILSDLHTILLLNNIKYHLDFGSLLGVVREHDFIKHDDDIDLTIVDQNPNPVSILTVLLKNGFGFIHAMMVKGRIVEFSVQKHNLSVDFFFYMPVDRLGKVGVCDVYFDPKVKYPSPDLNNYRIWYFPDDTKTQIVKFKDIDVCIPEKPEEVLEFEYGPGWKTPIKGWTGDCMKDRYEIMPDYATRITDLSTILNET